MAVRDLTEGVIYNPTHDMWVSFSTNDTAMSLINILVPYGQIGIGIGLILGLLTRFSAAMGTLMMLLFFFAAWDIEFGIVNQHLTYALVTFVIGYLGSGNFFGLDGCSPIGWDPDGSGDTSCRATRTPCTKARRPRRPQPDQRSARGRWRPATGAIGLSARIRAVSRLGPCSRS